MAHRYWKFSALYFVVAAIVLCLAIVTSLTTYLPKQIVAEAERVLLLRMLPFSHYMIIKPWA